MKKIKLDFGSTGILLLSFGFIFLFYGKILVSPNHFQFSDTGDAIKNYYTYAYYISNNVDNTNFEGLNYPYGENFLYTDCTPILSVSLRTLKLFFPGITNYSVGILNWLLIISFVISAYFIYLIFKELNINPFLSVLAALAIMALSPQIFRLTGHLALGFGFVIPLSIYLLLKFEKNKNSIKYPIILCVFELVFFFIHAYLGMIVALLLFSYILVRFALNIARNRIDKKVNLTLLAIIFIPIILFRLVIYLTDIHFGRTNNPWGFFIAHSNFNSVFLPNHLPLKPFFNIIFPGYQQIWEGWAYIGITSLIIIIYYLIMLVKKSVLQKKIVFNNRWFDNQYLQILLISSILLLLFSMAFPFRLKLEWLLDYFSFLKQFRAVGRFAWVFYFVITISSVYFIDRISKYFLSRNKKIFAFLLIIFLPGFYLAEAIPYHTETSEKVTTSPNLFDFNQLDNHLKEAIRNVNSSDYQAIFPMPFFCIGSENYGKFGTNKIYLLSQVISYHTSLPILGSYLTRTSIWESKNIMQVLAPGFYHKQIVDDLDSGKPFLVVFTHESLSKYEKRILSLYKPIYENEEFTLYRINPNDLFKNTSAIKIREFNNMKNLLSLRDGFFTNDSSGYFFFNDFENNPFHISRTGKGSYTGLKKNFNKLAHINKNELIPDQSYTASFWMYNQGENFGQDILNSMFILQEKQNNETKWTKIVNPAYSPVIDGDWSLVEMEFSLKDVNTEIDLILKGDDLSDKPVYIDDFLIYKTSTLNYKAIFDQQGRIDTLIKNNQFIFTKK